MLRYMVVALAVLAMVQICGPAAAQSGDKAKAEPLGELRIAVLDVQQVLRRAAAAQGIHTAMEARRKAFEAEIDQERQVLQTEEQELRRQATILSPEAGAQKRRELEKKFSDLQRKAEQRRGTLNRAFTGATRKLREEIAKVLAELMAERKITVTLAREAVLVFDQRLSVTDEILKRLDASLPSVTVEFSTPEN